MNREIVIAGICLLLTILIMWLANHQNKVSGSLILAIAFAILVLVSHFKNKQNTRATRLIRKQPEQK